MPVFASNYVSGSNYESGEAQTLPNEQLLVNNTKVFT